MLLKKLLYFLISAWLINALVCFHGSNPFEGSVAKTESGSQYVHAPNTLLKFLRHVKKGIKKDEDDASERISFNYRYVGRQHQSFQACWTSVHEWSSYSPILTELSTTDISPFIKTRRLLSPDLHIFRLTPF